MIYIRSATKLIIHTLGKQSKEGNSFKHLILLNLNNKNNISRIFVHYRVIWNKPNYDNEE